MASLKIVFNPFTGKFDYINKTQTTIPQYETFDPVSPSPEDTWVLHTGGIPMVAGSPIGLLLSLTYAGPSGGTYQLSYRTLEGTTKRVALT